MCWIRFESYIKEVATALFQCKADEILKPDALGKNNKTIRNSVKPCGIYYFKGFRSFTTHRFW